jgi:hypothetical protein
MKKRSIYSMDYFKKDRVVEPHKRNKDGVQWIVHRFPIKGGITLRDAMIYDMAHQTNPFLSMIRTA